MTRTGIAEAEIWALEGKRLHARGQHHKALELLQQSCEALPGRARVELDTAELGRRLGLVELAVRYYRRAAQSYARTGQARHAITPLRTALHFEQSRLPGSATEVASICSELSAVLVGLGFTADARQMLEHTVNVFVERRLAVPEELALLTAPMRAPNARGSVSPAPTHSAR